MKGRTQTTQTTQLWVWNTRREKVSSSQSRRWSGEPRREDRCVQEHSGRTGGGGDAWVGRDWPDLPHLRYSCTRLGKEQPPHQQLSGERALLSNHPLVTQPYLPGHQGQQGAHPVAEVPLPGTVLYRHCPVWGMATGEATTWTTHRFPHMTHARGITTVADLQPSRTGLWRTPGTLSPVETLTWEAANLALVLLLVPLKISKHLFETLPSLSPCLPILCYF